MDKIKDIDLKLSESTKFYINSMEKKPNLLKNISGIPLKYFGNEKTTISVRSEETFNMDSIFIRKSSRNGIRFKH